MIDRIRHDIQDRLDQVLREAEKLRRALVALGTRDGTASPSSASSTSGSAPRTRTRSASGSGSRTRKAATSKPAAAAAKPRGGSGSTATSRPRGRTAAGATKNAVLAALAGGEAMTAGEVAAATGLGRATVSTTLSKLAKTGELTKAERGYRRAKSASADGSSDSATAVGRPT